MSIFGPRRGSTLIVGLLCAAGCATTPARPPRAAPAATVRLQAHPDDGVQHLEEATP